MSYNSIVEMSNSTSLASRITACAAAEGVSDPQAWVAERRWQFVTQPGWAEDWDYAKGVYTRQYNPDMGARPDVISDEKILAAVQAIATAQ